MKKELIVDRELLDSWVKAGYATFDIGDGAWGWIKNCGLPGHIRTVLSSLLYGENWVSKPILDMLPNYGFTRDGYPLIGE